MNSSKEKCVNCILRMACPEREEIHEDNFAVTDCDNFKSDSEPDVVIGKQYLNNNGKDYTLLAVVDKRALLFGGNDYVVIDNIEGFIQNGCWSGGVYFPCWDASGSILALKKAFYYLENREFLTEDSAIYD